MAYYLTPFRRMANLNRMMDRRLSDEFLASPRNGQSSVYIPLNVEVSDDAYEITALIPGLKSDDVHIQVLNDTITIQGELPVLVSEFERCLAPRDPQRRIPPGDQAPGGARSGKV